jgi:hypothetical protein
MLLHRVLRRAGVRARKSGAGASFPVTLTFALSTEDSDSGVSGTANATDENLAFSFVPVTPRVGLPIDLEISEGATLVLVVTFPDDYSGEAYTFTETDGTDHAGTFPATHDTVSY